MLRAIESNSFKITKVQDLRGDCSSIKIISMNVDEDDIMIINKEDIDDLIQMLQKTKELLS